MAPIPSLNPDHIAGGFDWAKPPSCRCGLLASAIEEKVIFVSNMIDGGYSVCYVFLLNNEGSLHRSTGTPIQYCPWCGEKIQVRKK